MSDFKLRWTLVLGLVWRNYIKWRQYHFTSFYINKLISYFDVCVDEDIKLFLVLVCQTFAYALKAFILILNNFFIPGCTYLSMPGNKSKKILSNLIENKIFLAVFFLWGGTHGHSRGKNIITGWADRGAGSLTPPVPLKTQNGLIKKLLILSSCNAFLIFWVYTGTVVIPRGLFHNKTGEGATGPPFFYTLFLKTDPYLISSKLCIIC